MVKQLGEVIEMKTISNLYEMVIVYNFKINCIEPAWKAFNDALRLVHPGVEETEMPLYVEVCKKYKNEA